MRFRFILVLAIALINVVVMANSSFATDDDDCGYMGCGYHKDDQQAIKKSAPKAEVSYLSEDEGKKNVNPDNLVGATKKQELDELLTKSSK